MSGAKVRQVLCGVTVLDREGRVQSEEPVEMNEAGIDPLMDEWMRLAERDVPGRTPEEKLENLMAELRNEPPDIQQIFRQVMAEEFGVSKSGEAAGE